VPVGAFTLNPAEARRLFVRGFGFVAVGIDAHFLLSAAREALIAARTSVAS
jgi:2-keto-3-deoxy-L-rhamnonate aldolase RhmA